LFGINEPGDRASKGQYRERFAAAALSFKKIAPFIGAYTRDRVKDVIRDVPRYRNVFKMSPAAG
jgi:hypothetical protein